MALRTPRSSSAIVVILALAAVVLSEQGVAASTSLEAPWTLAQDHSDRKCTVTLHFDAAGAAGALAMPAGCRRALPALTAARSWSIDDDGSIQLRDATGQSLLTFSRRGDGVWMGDDESGRSYTLAPPSAATQAGAEGSDGMTTGPVALADPQIMAGAPQAPRLDRSVVQLAAAAPAKTKPAASDPAAAGRYAVMRGDRDTGCMVTLEAGKGASRARLAPACRDQGITIFDPVSWHMKGGSLVLVARKGHSIELDKNDSGVWVKTPQDAKALGLKAL